MTTDENKTMRKYKHDSRIVVSITRPRETRGSDVHYRGTLEDAKQWADANIDASLYAGYPKAHARIWQVDRGVDKGSWLIVLYMGTKKVSSG